MTQSSDIRQIAAMVQINAQTIANIHKISDQIAEVDRKIRNIQQARDNDSFIMGDISVLSNTLGSEKLMLLPPHCPKLLDIMEILQRQERARHMERLDELGIVLTELPDLGPPPAPVTFSID